MNKKIQRAILNQQIFYSNLKIKQIEKAIEELQRAKYLTTEKVSRMVYKKIKSQRLFIDLAVDIDLKILNEINMGTYYTQIKLVRTFRSIWQRK